MGAVDAVEWACVLCGHHIQNDRVSRATYLHHILHWLEHSSSETIQMIQKAAAMGNWWLAASSQQCACSCIRSYAEIFVEISNNPGDSAPLQPRFGALWLLTFPKAQITFEREEISDCLWDSVKYDGPAVGDWENCVRSKVSTMKGTEMSLSFVQCFLFLVSSSMSLFFIFNSWIHYEYTHTHIHMCMCVCIQITYWHTWWGSGQQDPVLWQQ